MTTDTNRPDLLDRLACIAGLADRATANLIEEARTEIGCLRLAARKFFKADGTSELLDDPAEVVRRRIAAAGVINRLRSAIAAVVANHDAPITMSIDGVEVQGGDGPCRCEDCDILRPLVAGLPEA